MQTAILKKNGVISAEQTINLIKSQIPYFTEEGDLYSALIRLKKHHYGLRKTELTEQEMRLYDLLLRNNINPDTAYHYLKLYMVQDEVKARYEKGKISRKQIENMGLNELRRSNVRKFLSILIDGRKLFEELEWS